MTGTDTNSNNKYFCNNCLDRNYLIECGDGCGQVIFKFDSRGRPRRYSKNHGKKGQLNPNWRGGRKKHENYWMLLLPDYYASEESGYIKEHIYFFQEYYQCCMLPWGIVHHIIPVSKDYCNNMPWNLMGMTASQHRILHNKFKEYKTIDKSDWRCSDPECIDPNFRYFDKRGYEQWYRNDKNERLCRRCYNRRYDKNKRIRKGEDKGA